MPEDVLEPSLSAGLLVAVTGVLAWVSGRPFVFPSLGPSAYMLASIPGDDRLSARRVLGGHLVGVLAGLAAYHVLASGLVITPAAPPRSFGQLRLAASAVCSVALTTGGMRATETMHAPACATTLIVSLGLLPSVLDGVVIMTAVSLLFATHVLQVRVGSG